MNAEHAWSPCDRLSIKIVAKSSQNIRHRKVLIQKKAQQRLFEGMSAIPNSVKYRRIQCILEAAQNVNQGKEQ